jgi:DNA-binding beta-propeller fold protein YncE
VKKSSAIWLVLILIVASALRSQSAQPLKLISTVPLPDIVGDLEFFASDLKGNRLFLCAEESKTVEVFNLRTDERIRAITGFGEPHSIAYLPDSDELIVSDGGDNFGWVDRVSAATYKIVNRIKLPSDVDEAMFDPVTRYFYVESGPDKSGTPDHLINVIDVARFRLIGQIPIPGKESSAMAVDHATERLYVNNSLLGEIAVVDLRTSKVSARWPLPGTHHLNGLAFDEVNHRLFSASRVPDKFWVIDTVNGRIIATLPCAPSNDNLIYDPARKRIYITGDGAATVIQQQDADHYENIADVPTGYRAKTSLLVPELNRLYIALSGKGPGGGPSKAGVKLAVQIYEVQP